MFGINRNYFCFIINGCFLINFQPHIIASLLAIKIFLLNFVITIVGKRPLIPGIEEIVISDFFLILDL